LNPRLVLIVAGAGWGKTSLVRQLLSRGLSGAYCDLRDVLDGDQAARELEEAYGASPPERIAIDQVDALERVGWGALEDFMRRVDPATQVVLLAHRRPEIDLSWFAAPHEVLTLRPKDLAFSEADCIELFVSGGAEELQARMAYAATSGWPVSTLVLLRLAREGRLVESLRDLTGAAFADLHQYIKARTIDRLPREACDALVAVAALGQATAGDLELVAGTAAVEALERQMKIGVPYVRHYDQRFEVTPFVRATLLARYERGVRNVRETASELFLQNGAYLRAARVAADARAWEQLVRALELAIEHQAAPEAEIQALLRRAPFEFLVPSARLLAYYLSDELVVARPHELLARVRETLRSWRSGGDPVARYGADVALLVGHRIANELDEASEIVARLNEVPIPADADLLGALFAGERAALASSLGRIDDAEAEIHSIADRAFPISAQRFTVEFNRYLFDGQTVELLDLSDQFVRRARRLGDFAALQRALFYRAIAAFFAQDRSVFEGAVRDALAVPPSRPIPRAYAELNGARYPLHMDTLRSIDAAFEGSDVAIAAEVLQDAQRRLDDLKKPFWSAFARVMLAAVPGVDRSSVLDAAMAFARNTQSQKLVQDVRALQDGSSLSGPLKNPMERVSASPLLRGARAVRVSILERTVARGGEDLPVRAREFEILALLVLHESAMPVEAICDAVWPDADADTALSALRMSVHRLRKQLGDADTIESVPQGYRIGPMVSCDIIEAERAIAVARGLPEYGTHERLRLQRMFASFAAPAMASGGKFSWWDRIEARITGVCHALGMMLGREALERGDHAAAIAFAEAVLAVDAYDEPAVELLVRALAVAGERAEAIRRYRQYTERLKLDYGVDTTLQLAALIDAADRREAGTLASVT
jgi:DNA-binding SARP family transcriptional activator